MPLPVLLVAKWEEGGRVDGGETCQQVLVQ
jgi:hypothetical protein